MITIHNFPRGARGLRVAWLCEEMGLAYEVKKLSFPTDAAYRQLNPLGSVPFLEDGNVRMNESAAMMIYVAERYGPTPLLPERTSPHYARALQMTVFSEATTSPSVTKSETASIIGGRRFRPSRAASTSAARLRSTASGERRARSARRRSTCSSSTDGSIVMVGIGVSSLASSVFTPITSCRRSSMARWAA